MMLRRQPSSQPCERCSRQPDVQRRRVECLGCGLKFYLCEVCWQVWTGCDDECRGVAREVMREIDIWKRKLA